jgi:hypothetical protein
LIKIRADFFEINFVYFFLVYPINPIKTTTTTKTTTITTTPTKPTTTTTMTTTTTTSTTTEKNVINNFDFAVADKLSEEKNAFYSGNKSSKHST